MMKTYRAFQNELQSNLEKKRSANVGNEMEKFTAPLLILFLYLPLFASLASELPETSAPATTSIAEAPKSFSCDLITPKGPIKVKAERALFQVGLEKGSKRGIPLVAFFDPGTKQPWIGLQSGVYVRTSRGIFGFTIMGSGMTPRKSLFDAGNANMRNLSELWTAFRKAITAKALYDEDDLVGSINLIKQLPVDFGAAEARSSQMGRPKIDSCSLEKEGIKFRISNQSGEYKAEVVIDEGTLQIKSAAMR